MQSTDLMFSHEFKRLCDLGKDVNIRYVLGIYHIRIEDGGDNFQL
jgi:hypothetical protein